jgi:hypothetical protein
MNIDYPAIARTQLPKKRTLKKQDPLLPWKKNVPNVLYVLWKILSYIFLMEESSQ